MGHGVTRRLGTAALLDPEGERDRRDTLAAIDRFLVKYYGERCSTMSGGCPCCIVWAARDMLAATITE